MRISATLAFFVYAISTANSGVVRPAPVDCRSAICLSDGRNSSATVEPALALERVEVAGVDVRPSAGLPTGDRQRQRLRPVVVEHELGDLVGHLVEQLVALLERQLAGRHHVAEQDLDVDLVVAAVDAGRVVDRVGVDQPAGERVLDPAELGEAEVAALADHPAAQLGAVDAHRVVGAVADLGVRLGGRLDVGADAAVPEQVDRRPRTALISSVGVTCSAAIPSAARISGVTSIDLALRGNTPPPARSAGS